jgi:hypothetical protein
VNFLGPCATMNNAVLPAFTPNVSARIGSSAHFD